MGLDTLIDPAALARGDHVTVWAVNEDGAPTSGQGGTFVSLADGVVTIDTPRGEQSYRLADSYEVWQEQPIPADECLEYDPDECSGPVELHWPGSGHKSWPRCQHHGDRRVKRAENSIERYADSDIPPPNFHRSWGGANEYGEHWSEEDY